MNAPVVGKPERPDSPQQQAKALFTRCFGGLPQGQVRAPGRVNLIGEHTDYNDGFVLPCALDFHTVVAWRARPDALVRVAAAGIGETPVTINLADPLLRSASVHWSDYVRSMLWAWRESGRALAGLDLSIAGNVPQGAGLSSSAALEVALGCALQSAVGGAPIDPTGIALMAQKAENDFVGCHCGNMDQLISAHGRPDHAVLIDCRSLALQAVPLPQKASVVVIDSKVQRGLVDSEYNLRRQQCEQAARHLGVKALRDADLAMLEQHAAGLNSVAFRRARHVVTENQRTLEAARALQAADLSAMGRLMAASHRSMRDDFEITVPAIDHIVELVGQELDSEGGVRMTGGGFGGCVVALVPHERVAALRARLARDYRSPSGVPAAVYACRAQAGAGPLTDEH